MTASSGGSSAGSYAQAGDAQRWKSRPLAAALIRVGVRLGPLVLAFVVAGFIGDAIEPREGPFGLMLWIGMVFVVSTATLVVSDRFFERLLPLATLLRLSLAFPDEAPSRFRFALRSGTAKQLEQRLEAGALGRNEGDAARTLLTLMTVLRDHDRITRGHSERVRAYSMLIAERLELGQNDRDRLQWGALAHDVGKLAVEPEILNKKGRLNENQWRELREHPAAAGPLIEPLRGWLGEWAEAATQHHERFDGAGYPAGLAGTDITLAGRIVAVADAYDTMTSLRSYKDPLPAEDAMAELTRNAGTQFDPDVVRAFLAVPLRRVRLVLGSFGWLGHIPFLAEAPAVSGAAGSVAGVATAVVATTAVVTGAITPSLGFLDDEGLPLGWVPGVEETTGGAERVAPPSHAALPDAAPSDVAPPDAGPPEEEPSSAEPTTTSSDGPATTSTTIDPAPDSTAPPGSTSSTTSTTAPIPPQVVDDSFVVTVGEMKALQVRENDFDPDGDLDPQSVSVVEEPRHALWWDVTPGGVVRYRARDADDEQLSLTDSFVYEVCDFDGLCGSASATITIDGG